MVATRCLGITLGWSDGEVTQLHHINVCQNMSKPYHMPYQSVVVGIYHCNVSEPDLGLLIEMTDIFLGWVWDG